MSKAEKRIKLLRSLINNEKTLIEVIDELDVELIKEYINYCDNLDSIPICFINDEVISYYVQRYVISSYFLNKIPDYILESKYGVQIINEYLKMHEKNKNWIFYIPQKFLTSKMIIKYINDFKTVKFISTEMITPEIAYCIVENNLMGELSKGTKRYVRKAANDYKKIKDIVECEYYVDVKNDLISSLETEIIIENITSSYKVTKQYVLDVLSMIEHEDSELSSKIKESLELNKELHLLTVYKDAVKIKEIIKSLGCISYQNGLTREQKIQFATLFSNYGIKSTITEIYSVIRKNKILYEEDFIIVYRFLNIFLGYQFYQTVEDLNINNDEKYLSEYNNDWILEYKSKQYFKIKNGKATISYKFIDKTGEIIELTQELADEIIEILKENEIPLRNCIVKEAFRQYANGELEGFMDYINNGLSTKNKVKIYRN